MQKRIYWNDGWKFKETYENQMRETAYQDDAWEDVRLPHTCKETPFHYFDESSYQMVCCYRKHFFAPEEWKDQTVIVTFEGIAHEAQVFLNGKRIGEHHCGYTAFSIDISKKLRIGAENVLTVRVDSRENLNIPPFGYVIDYMTYGGIYREAYVDLKNETYLAEEKPGRKIHIFNSKSASIGQTLIGMKIQECEEAGYSFEKVIETVDEYIAGQHTFFVLDNLETLRKNGRLSKVKALVASALKIKPVMGSTDEGNICQLDQARGINKALVKMAGQIAEKTQNSEEKVLAISHCNCHERAILLKNALQEKMPLKNIVVLDTAGVSSMYANDGGVIVAV